MDATRVDRFELATSTLATASFPDGFRARLGALGHRDWVRFGAGKIEHLVVPPTALDVRQSSLVLSPAATADPDPTVVVEVSPARIRIFRSASADIVVEFVAAHPVQVRVLNCARLNDPGLPDARFLLGLPLELLLSACLLAGFRPEQLGPYMTPRDLGRGDDVELRRIVDVLVAAGFGDLDAAGMEVAAGLAEGWSSPPAELVVAAARVASIST